MASTSQPDTSAPCAQIAPFAANIEQSAIDDLKNRLATTRWIEREPVNDWRQGVPLSKAEELVTYWRDGYDWRCFEKRLNTFPQFTTNIDGLGIHFLHVRSRQVDKGGHFAAFEQPTLFTTEVRNAFRTVRYQHTHDHHTTTEITPIFDTKEITLYCSGARPQSGGHHEAGEGVMQVSDAKCRATADLLTARLGLGPTRFTVGSRGSA